MSLGSEGDPGGALWMRCSAEYAPTTLPGEQRALLEESDWSRAGWGLRSARYLAV